MLSTKASISETIDRIDIVMIKLTTSSVSMSIFRRSRPRSRRAVVTESSKLSISFRLSKRSLYVVRLFSSDMATKIWRMRC
jgi:hypothetical protein